MNALSRKMLFGAGTALGLCWMARRLSRPDFSFRDKVVVVTGGSRGLGLEMGRIFAAEGARLAICARTAAPIDRAVNELNRRTPEVLGQVCDVTDEQAVRQFVAAVETRWNRVDVLVNNAGVIQVGPHDCMTVHDYEVSLATHFRGPLFLTQAVFPLMRRQGEGRIVNVSSIGGQIGVPHLLPYVAGKFALRGWSQALTAELRKHGIRVTTVTPGLMRTGSPRNADFKGRHREEYLLFSLSGSLPFTAVHSSVAARRIVEACRRGAAVESVTWTSAIAARLNGLFPGLMTQWMTAIDPQLPNSDGGSRQSKKGWQSESAWSPSWLTQLNERAAVRNNEL